MKKCIKFIIIVLGLLLLVNHYYSQFTLSNRAYLSANSVELNENYYVGYGLHWRGFIKPTLKDVKLRNKDGYILDHSHVEVEAFLDLLQHTGTSNEADLQDYISKGLAEYIPMPINSDYIGAVNNLVLRINVKDEDYINEVAALELHYSILGVPKKQVLEYDGFLK